MAQEAPRDTTSTMGYIQRNPQPEAGIMANRFTGGDFDTFKKHRQMLIDNQEIRFLDARAVVGGVEKFQLDKHGFTLVKPAPPAVDFKNRKEVIKDYFPRIAELARATTGAEKAWVFVHTLRDEDPKKNGLGPGSAYSRFAHTDGSSKSPALWRKLLAGDFFKVPEEYLESHDLAMVNVWHPRDRPAFKDPLCLLDVTSLDPAGADISPIPQIDVSEDGKVTANEGPVPESPVNLIAYIAGPSYNPNHRWYFLPDQTPEECWVFKIYDERPGVAKSCFHNSFHDACHEEKPKETHGRRSIEFNLLLSFPRGGGSGGLAGASKL